MLSLCVSGSDEQCVIQKYGFSRPQTLGRRGVEQGEELLHPGHPALQAAQVAQEDRRD